MKSIAAGPLGPGSCASQRNPATVACGDCKRGSYETGEECQECGEVDAIPIIMFALICTMSVVVVTLLINSKVQNTPTSSLRIVVLSGLLFTSLQLSEPNPLRLPARDQNCRQRLDLVPP